MSGDIKHLHPLVVPKCSYCKLEKTDIHGCNMMNLYDPFYDIMIQVMRT